MNKAKKIIVSAIILGILIVFPAAAQKTKSEFQKMYMDFLKKGGHTPSIDEDGDILFKHQGDNYIIIINEKDPQLFEVYYPLNVTNFPIQTSIEAANYASRNTDVVRVFVLADGKTAIISVSLLLLKPKDFQTFFPRILKLIDEALDNFTSQL